MKNLIILGTGGTCVDIRDIVLDINDDAGREVYRCIGFLDDDPKKLGRDFHGVKVLGNLASAVQYPDCLFVNGIGSPRDFWKKPDILARTGIPLEKFATLIHPSAQISRTAKLGAGTVIFPLVTVGVDAVIGNHVVVLPNSVISHNAVIGDYGCIAGGACVSGGVKVGRSCYLGAKSSIIDGAVIGEEVLIGMGSVVIKNVPDNSVVAGNPARYLRKTRPKA